MKASKRTPRPKQFSRTLGGNLRHFRKTWGMTQLELAESAGLDRSYVGHIELDNRDPSFSTICKLAKALGTHWATLIPY